MRTSANAIFVTCHNEAFNWVREEHSHSPKPFRPVAKPWIHSWTLISYCACLALLTAALTPKPGPLVHMNIAVDYSPPEV